MTNEEYILDWYKNHIWTRPSLSKVCDGVGMVAIRDIPKGTSIYEFPDREEAGTPNILGAITLGSAIEILDNIGMDNILRSDINLTNYALREMDKIDDLVIYGNSNSDTCPRAGTISFNLKGFNHGLVGWIRC